MASEFLEYGSRNCDRKRSELWSLVRVCRRLQARKPAHSRITKLLCLLVCLIKFLCLAGKTKGRSKKWKELLKFPHHTISAPLKNEREFSSWCMSLWKFVVWFVAVRLLSVCLISFESHLFSSDWLRVCSLYIVNLTYDRICEKEPIGRELFRQFCAGNAQLQRAIDFLDEVVRVPSLAISLHIRTILRKFTDNLNYTTEAFINESLLSSLVFELGRIW